MNAIKTDILIKIIGEWTEEEYNHNSKKKKKRNSKKKTEKKNRIRRPVVAPLSSELGRENKIFAHFD